MSLDLPILNNNLGRAACADIPEELKRKFYGVGNSQMKAKEVCNGSSSRPPCPVKAQCLAEALEVEHDPDNEDARHGVWGGMTSREREEAWPRPARVSRLRTRCASGRHELNEWNVIVWGGTRRCGECAQESRNRLRSVAG